MLTKKSSAFRACMGSLLHLGDKLVAAERTE